MFNFILSKYEANKTNFCVDKLSRMFITDKKQLVVSAETNPQLFIPNFPKMNFFTKSGDKKCLSPRDKHFSTLININMKLSKKSL